jgi:hypothetical protein
MSLEHTAAFFILLILTPVLCMIGFWISDQLRRK